MVGPATTPAPIPAGILDLDPMGIKKSRVENMKLLRNELQIGEGPQKCSRSGFHMPNAIGFSLPLGTLLALSAACEKRISPPCARLDLLHLHPRFPLLQNPDDLLFYKTALLHGRFSFGLYTPENPH